MFKILLKPFQDSELKIATKSIKNQTKTYDQKPKEN